MRTVSDEGVEYELANRLHHETNVQQLESKGHKTSRYMAINRRAVEDGILDDPVVDGEANQDDDRAEGNDGRVHESKPDYLDGLGKVFSKGRGLVHHEVVSLSLSELAFAVADLSSNNPHELQRVDQPQKGNEEGIDDEHDGLFLNDAVLVLVDVVESDSLDE